MSAYLIVTAIFFALGTYIFVLCRWWLGHLRLLADRYDIPERRKRATRRYFVVLLFVFVPILAAVLGGIAMAPKLGVFVVIAFICSIVPAAISLFRSMPSLYALKYGRQRK